MEIRVQKHKGKNEYEAVDLKIHSCKPVLQPSNLLLVRNGEMTVEEDGNTQCQWLEIYKVQCIVSCKSTVFEEAFLVVLYVDENMELRNFVVSDLSSPYISDERFSVIDYNSYVELCNLTGESVLPFAEYFNELIKGHAGANSILNYKGKYLNYDQQKDLWQSSASQKNMS